MSAALSALLRQQATALGRRLQPTDTFRRTIRREVGGRPYSEIVRRVSPPCRYRDDLSVDGAWRFSEAFDGEQAWYRDHRHPAPTPATGALDVYRWAGLRLDHQQPLAALTRLGCTLADTAVQATFDGRLFPTVRVSLMDRFAETVFLDAEGRIAAHHLDRPEPDEEDRDLETWIREWRTDNGVVHPARALVVDRRTGEDVAEILVIRAATEPFSPEVYTLMAD